MNSNRNCPLSCNFPSVTVSWPSISDGGSTSSRSWAPAIGAIGPSVPMEVTEEGILSNITNVATYDAMCHNEWDEMVWDSLLRHLGDTIFTQFVSTPNQAGEMQSPASGAELWGRPLWAWTWQERLLAHAMMIALELIGRFPSKIRVLISNSKDCCSFTKYAHDSTSRLPVYVHYVKFPPPNGSNYSVWRDDDEHDDEASIDTPLLVDVTRQASCIVSQTSYSHHVKLNDNKNSPNKKIIQDDHQNVTEGLFGSQQNNQLESPKTRRNVDSVESTQFESSNEPPKVTPSLKANGPPQFDSQGIDLCLLSQLPVKVRSEVRLALAIQARINKREKVSKSSIRRWFTESKKAVHHQSKGESRIG